VIEIEDTADETVCTVAGPRQIINFAADPWKPKAWTYARPAAGDALRIPSLGDEVRKPPTLITSKVQAFAARSRT